MNVYRKIRELEYGEFEKLCQILLPEIASHVGKNPTSHPSPMAPSRDGGVEGKIRTQSGYVAIQCKKYTDFKKEVASVKKSFKTLLKTKVHLGVNSYVWCSCSPKTTEREEYADNAIDEMSAEAKSKGRKVAINILFAEDLAYLIKTKRPAALYVLQGNELITEKNLNDYTRKVLYNSRYRFPESDSLELAYSNQRTEQMLKEFEVGDFDKKRLTNIGILKDELKRRESEFNASKDDLLNKSIGDFVRSASDYLIAVDNSKASDNEILKLEKANKKIRNDIISIYRNYTSIGVYSMEGMKLKRLIPTVNALGKLLDDEISLGKAKIKKQVLIRGGWGSGKTYNLAKYAETRLNLGEPTLFLRARDFTDSNKLVLSQPWRQYLPHPQLTEDYLLACLSSIALEAKTDVLLIIDGINESTVTSKVEVIHQLSQQVSKFYGIKLILSERCDKSAPENEILPHFDHHPPEPEEIVDAYEKQTRAGIGGWLRQIISNPLMASIAIRIASSKKLDSFSHRELGRKSLIEEWSKLVIYEASQKLDFPVTTLNKVVRYVENNGGCVEASDISKELSLSGKDLDRIVECMSAEGLLEWRDPEYKSVGYHWQAASSTMELLHGMKEAASRNEAKRYVANKLNSVELGELPFTAVTLAEIVPESGFELLDVTIEDDRRNECQCSFAESLEFRPDDRILDHTINLVRQLIKQSGEPGATVLAMLMSREVGSRLAIHNMLEMFQESDNFERSDYWPYLVHYTLSKSFSLRQRFLEGLSYLQEEFNRATDQSDIRKQILRFFMWLGCCRSENDIIQIAASVIAEFLHKDSDLFGESIDYAVQTRDDHVLNMLIIGAHGALMRWPKDNRLSEFCDILRKLLADDNRRPKSMTALSELYELLHVPLSFHLFLKKYVSEPKFQFFRKKGGFIDEEHRSMFDDLRKSSKVWRSESALYKAVAGRRRLCESYLDPSLGVLSFESKYTHLRSLLYGRWAALQGAYYKFLHGTSWREGHLLKAGTEKFFKYSRSADNLAYLEHPSNWWRDCVDPSLPSKYLLESSDTVRHDTWWKVMPDVQASISSWLTVVEPEERIEWLVICGGFRFEEPLRRQWVNKFGHVNYMVESGLPPVSYDDGYPSQGAGRHDYVEIRATATSSVRSSSTIFDNYADDEKLCRYAEIVYKDDGRAELAVQHEGVPPCFVPSKFLLDLLNCHWTGDDAICKTRDDLKIIFDPGLGVGGPHALLVRKDRLLDCLQDKEISLEIKVRCVQFDESLTNKSEITLTLNLPEFMSFSSDIYGCH